MKRFSILLVIVLGLALAACGDDDGDGGGEPLTKEEFITAADQICAEGDAATEAQTEEILGNVQGAPSEEQLTELISDVLVPSLEQQADEIDALTPPEEDAETVDEIVSKLRDGIEEAKDDPVGLFEGDGGSIAEAGILAQEYGLTDCGS